MKTVELSLLDIDIITFWLDVALGLESDEIEQEMIVAIIEKLGGL